MRAGHQNQAVLREIALDVVLHYHERLSGNGYPHKLAGNLISPFVRIVTIADIFDALTTDRPHRKGHSTLSAISVMHQSMRDDLDSNLLKLFVEMMGDTSAPGTKPKLPKRPEQRLFHANQYTPNSAKPQCPHHSNPLHRQHPAP